MPGVGERRGRRSWASARLVGSLLVASVAGAEPIGFNEHIRPILAGRCVACHGGVEQAAGLSFVYRDEILPPDGWVVEPGNPDGSLLLERVASTDAETRMPPPDHGPALTDREVDLLRCWIAEGAVWEEHWAFGPIADPDPPAVANADWPSRPLDRFVLARLDREGLKPTRDADPSRWLRRVSLDLVGLPPEPAERERFLVDVTERGEAAYEAAVDRLLASPHFGERWASVWLDQVRYADSKGLGQDGPRTIWAYRDWVIRAFNDDLPYDLFTVKQMAGDLLPDRSPSDVVATACHRLTQTNEEGGTDDEEFRVAAVIDRVSTTWQVWQGITFGCVQCHSHPYEPIRHEDFYRFSAFFNNTADCDLSEELPHYRAPTDPADEAEAGRLDAEIGALREAIWFAEHGAATRSTWTPLTELVATSRKATRLQTETRAGHVEFRTVGTVEQGSDIAVDAALPEGVDRLAAVRVTGLPRDPERAERDSEWGFVWSHVRVELLRSGAEKPTPLAIAHLIGDEPQPLIDPAGSLDPESGFGFAAYSRIHHARTAVLLLAEPVAIGAGDRLGVTLEHDRKTYGGAYGLVTQRGRVAVTDDERLAEAVGSDDLHRKKRRLADLRRRRAEIPSVATPVLQERPSWLARPTHVLHRGLFLDKAERVSAGTPASLPPLRPASGEPTRLDLARWLVSDENPLTARVAVNRYWARLFGVGLVETEEDFGSSGAPSSHPRLLDHLASRFRDDLAWSTKRLLREIVLSRTYRQSAIAPAELRARDPANRLLARGPRVRLPAETVRDQALSVSGLLDRTLHGPPVRPPIPEGVWRPFQAGDKWPETDPGDASRYRRSIYTYTKRSIPYPMHAAFDRPSREFCTPRRLRSNTPMQALVMLNGETMTECARGLAERMRAGGGPVDDQIARGFVIALGRPPSRAEAAVTRRLASSDGAGDGLDRVASALLNLDEFLCQ